jgi:hypothetical protein
MKSQLGTACQSLDVMNLRCRAGHAGAGVVAVRILAHWMVGQHLPPHLLPPRRRADACSFGKRRVAVSHVAVIRLMTARPGSLMRRAVCATLDQGRTAWVVAGFFHGVIFQPSQHRTE